MNTARDTGPVEPPRDSDDAVTYLSTQQMCALYNLSEETFYRLRDSAWGLDPDVIVGRQPGWDERRAVDWGKDTGRLDNQLRPSRATRQGKPHHKEEPPTWYRKIPMRYMSGQQAALFMGMNKDGMFRLKRRGDAPTPAVRIGANTDRPVDGFEGATCMIFALRRGFLTPAKLTEEHLILIPRLPPEMQENLRRDLKALEGEYEKLKVAVEQGYLTAPQLTRQQRELVPRLPEHLQQVLQDQERKAALQRLEEGLRQGKLKAAGLTKKQWDLVPSLPQDLRTALKKESRSNK